ncbi:hypothetical protein GECvBMG_gp216c [Salmonella phage GEC_vB_MG]|uniref:Uncharacterized protein 183 n=3 Tax=Seunavirus TaxID=1914851 RepID=G3BM49_9CAUD|nr:hypothetical protein PVP-SE1_gp183 [Salmonella phage PVPSE1]YP_009148936.1 hypothetical protein ACQ19_gp140 [Salmonella phage SSE121]QPI14760.1 hypothetical protein GECvBMG_gp216c [Salmonella phage GEC_vB_MG]WNT48233.1 hypothetical protein SPLA5a_PHROGS00150 [Salmonella phage SPLA5a]ADP02579.1 conserved hypothetical protein [Salmonella phage PVPSE1]AFU63781.1 hypothetical protein [Salmonella phage SSE121]
MIKNATGQTEFLRNLIAGEKSVWYCKDQNVDPEMRKMTATVCKAKLGFKIRQSKALIVTPDSIPQAIIIVERIS